jgi:hypothetical protein
VFLSKELNVLKSFLMIFVIRWWHVIFWVLRWFLLLLIVRWRWLLIFVEEVLKEWIITVGGVAGIVATLSDLELIEEDLKKILSLLGGFKTLHEDRILSNQVTIENLDLINMLKGNDLELFNEFRIGEGEDTPLISGLSKVCIGEVLKSIEGIQGYIRGHDGELS